MKKLLLTILFTLFLNGGVKADLMQKKYNCPKTRFIKAYDSNGIPQPVKIKGKLLKDYNNQTIIVGK